MLLRVTKKITAILLVLIMLISFLPANLQANAAESYSVKVTGSTVNVRSGAGTKYGKVGSAKKNQSFKYTDLCQ